MAIQARLFDGTTLEFPDGTDPAVIDRVAAEETAARNNQAAQAPQAKPAVEEKLVQQPGKEPSTSWWRPEALYQDVPVGIAKGVVDVARSTVKSIEGENAPAKSIQELVANQLLKYANFSVDNPNLPNISLEIAKYVQNKFGLAPDNNDVLKGVSEYLQLLKSKGTQEIEAFNPTNPEDSILTRAADKASYMLRNPSTISTGLAETVGPMGEAGIMARALKPTKLSLANRLAAGEAGTAGLSTAQAIRDEQGGKPLTASQYVAVAANMILTGVATIAGGAAAKYLRVGDIDEILAGEMAGQITSRVAEKEIASRIGAALKSSAIEAGVEELPQSVVDQISFNVATGKPAFEGVPEAGVQGFLTASPLGAGAGAYQQHKINQRILGEEEYNKTKSQQKDWQEKQAKVNEKIDTQGMTAEEKRNYKLQQAGKPIPTTLAEKEAEEYVTGTNASVSGAGTNLSGESDTSKSEAGTGDTDRSGLAGIGGDAGTTTGRTNAQPTTLSATEKPIADAALQAGVKFNAPVHARNWVIKNVLNGDKDAAVQLEKNNPGIYKRLFETSKQAPVTPVAKTETIEAKTETPVFNEAELQEAGEVVKPKSPSEEVEDQQVEAEKLAEELLHSKEISEEAATETAPEAKEVIDEKEVAAEAAPIDKKELAKNKLADALARAGNKASKIGRTNIVPEEEEDWNSILRDLFSATVDMGFIKIEDAIEFVKTQLREYGIDVGIFKPEQFNEAYSQSTAGLRSESRRKQEAELEAKQKAFEAEAPGRASILDQKEAERIERAYPFPSVPTEITDEEKEGYEANRNALVEEEDDTGLPSWGELSTAERSLYTTINDVQGPNAAIKALADFREGKEGTPNRITDVNAAIYELNRKAASKEHKIKFPRWQSLSDKAQANFLFGLPKLSNKISAKQTPHSGKALHAAFGSVAEQLEKENVGFRGKRQIDIENAELAVQSEQAKEEYQTEEAKARAASKQAVGKGTKLSLSAIDALENDGINGVLDYLAESSQGINVIQTQLTSEGKAKPIKENNAFKYMRGIHKLASAKIFKALASTLRTVKFTSTVITDPNDLAIVALRKEGKLAEYDPKTDTFYFTPEGLDEATILHEVIHAATVKIINQFKTNPTSLTQSQRDAVQHLEKLFTFVSNRLGTKYPNATENIYEFVAYAMTDFKFQAELAKLQVPRLGRYTLTTEDGINLGNLVKTVWGQFTTALMQMHKLLTAKATKLELRPEIFEAVAKDFATVKGSLDELYQEIDDENLDTDEANLRKASLSEIDESEDMSKGPANFAPAARLLDIQKGFESNVLLEVSEVMNRILAAPEVGTEVEPLAARRIQIPQTPRAASAEARVKTKAEELSAKQSGKSAITIIYGHLKNPRKAYRFLVRQLQSNTKPLQLLERDLKMAKKLVRDERNQSMFNDTYSQVIKSMAKAYTITAQSIAPLETKVTKLITNIKKEATEFSPKELMDHLQLWYTGLHEPERRRWLFMKNVPLSSDVNYLVPVAGKMDTPANHRERLIASFENLKDTPGGMTALEKADVIKQHLDELIFETDPATGKAMTGDLLSPDATRRAGKLKLANMDRNQLASNPNRFLENHNDQSVVGGYTAEDISDFLSTLDSKPYKQKVMELFEALREIQEVTSNLNLQSNFYTQANLNYIRGSGYKWYVPFKGRPELEEKTVTNGFGDDQRYSSDLQFGETVAAGRESTATNPISQIIVDAKKAAYILAHQSVTQSVVNNIKQGNITGKKIKTISHADRYKEGLQKDRSTIWFNMPDGRVEIWKITDQNVLEALRKPYKQYSSELTKNIANTVSTGTRLVGQGFTLFNIKFPPANAVKDMIPNLFFIGSEYGFTPAIEYLVNIVNTATADTIVGGGVFSAGTAMYHYQNKNFAALREKAKKDEFTRYFLELALNNGIVTFAQGVSTDIEYKKLETEVDNAFKGDLNPKKIATAAYNQAVVPFEYWMHMSEVSVRVTAYKTVKDHLVSTGVPEQEAISEAATFTKELANFEHSGTSNFARNMARLYAFTRSTATGTVRFFQDLGYILPYAQSSAIADLSDSIKLDPVALANYKKNFSLKQRRTAIMTGVYIGLGMAVYTMALSGSEDDELGRNKIENDDPALWTRAMRFFLPGMKNPIQIPTGYGPGALISIGAQINMCVQGNQTYDELLDNMATILQDSFSPVQMSKIPITDDRFNWALDTLSPTILKGIVESAINKNGLGMQIVLDAMGNDSNAFTSHGNVPEWAKWAAETLNRESRNLFDDTVIDISPNTIYHLASNYVNGIVVFSDLAERYFMISKGERDYDITTENPIVDAFVGRPSRPDSREYIRIKKQIDRMEVALKSAEADPKSNVNEFEAKRPYDRQSIDNLRRFNVQLDELRHERKVIERNASELKYNEKQKLLEYNMRNQDLLKAEINRSLKIDNPKLRTAKDRGMN